MTAPSSLHPLRVLLGLVLVATGTACDSPVDDDLIESLGPEVPGLAEGVYHRYGQPCLACHGGPNSDSPLFWAGGTVFATPHDNIPVFNAAVRITDARGQVFETFTNCAGNFFFPAEALETTTTPAIPLMVFPLHAEVVCPTYEAEGKLSTETRRNVMGTRINREGSCNACHTATQGQDSPGRIYCMESQPAVPYRLNSCPGGPH